MEDPKNPGRAPAAETLSPEVLAVAQRIVAGLQKPSELSLGPPAILPGTPGASLPDCAGTLRLSSPHRLASRKLWVVIGTLAGMFAQLPADVVLPPVSQLVIGALAVVYIIVQGYIDHAQTRPVSPAEPAA